ncbi:MULTISPECIES: isochorismatase family cysteine hydrolase [Micrococcaceae]|uniref:isochorismatase family cysteine hydrolase n=1 Tax=Micrococcaceae TaxID=1268 RepID=UPI001618B285|nr:MULTISPECIES: isochorismatase family cysteine hydrolase [Micrococcaceae]MBB5747860.1 nicotinamidase-related amidase [Micrococcus sp. TA1]HRO30067.1 isochorismatase family cysteine hydrolase [Citricoccus sp.]HRO94556.1 isochorismatase family cysteine hydrolase [Citricoccus sp.]
MPDPTDLPDPGVPTAVLFVDLQEGFFEFPDLQDTRALLVEESNWLAAQAHAGGHAVFVVNTVHQEDKSTWTLKMLEDDQGFNFEGSWQASLLDGLDLEPARHLVKTRDSAFFGTDLVEQLREAGVHRLVLAGVTAESCVSATGRDAFAHDFEVVYARQAIASSDAERGWTDLENVSADFRQTILNRPEVQRLLTAK